MTKKTAFILLALFYFAATNAQAQEKIKFEKKFSFRNQFNQSFGYGFNVLGALGQGGIFIRGLNYTPRLNLLNLGEAKVASIDIAIPLNIGLQLSPQQGGSYIAIDVPVTAEISVGHFANRFVDAPVGAFAGIGLDYYKIPGFVIGENGPFYGIVTGGVRANFLGRSLTFRSTTVLANRLLGGFRGTLSLGLNF